MWRKQNKSQWILDSLIWGIELEYEAPIPKFRFGQKVQILNWFYAWQIWEIVWCRPEAESFIYRIISLDFELMNVEERFLSIFS